MGELIDLLLSNPFLVLLLIGGLFSILKRKNDQPESEAEQEPSRPRRPMPVETRQSRSHDKREPSQRQSKPVQESYETFSIEEQHEKQLEDLKMRLGTEERDTSIQRRQSLNVPQTRDRQVNNLVSKYNDEKFKKRFKENVTSTGLINSVIMSEVLGPPRAMKPYERTHLNRKKQR